MPAATALCIFNPPPEKLKFIDEEVVFVGSFYSAWGHAFTDHLKHFWFYFNEHYSHLKHLQFIYVVIDVLAKPYPHFFEMLKMMGIPIEQMQEITSPCQFKRVYVPDECFFCDMHLNHARRYTPEYLQMAARLPTMPAPKNCQKVYFSRTKFVLWKDFNEMTLENYFKKQGFTIIHPEKLHFQEELAILQHCQIFAATDGSIAHNLFFCQNVQTALILRKCRQITSHQITINSLKPDANIVYIDASFSPFANRSREWHNGPFFMYESNFLRAYFNEAPKMFPFWQFLKFLKWIYRAYFSFSYYDHRFLGFTHSFRAKLKIGTKVKQIKNYFFK